jgi:hypothetical protein
MTDPLRMSIILRPTVSRPVCLGIKHPFGAYDQIFITVWQLRVCWFGAPSLKRGRVCRLQLLLALAGAVIFGSESRRARDHILLSQIRDFPFRRLLRLAGLRWWHSTPPPHGNELWTNSFITSGRTMSYSFSVILFLFVAAKTCVSEPLASNGLFWLSGVMSQNFKNDVKTMRIM